MCIRDRIIRTLETLRGKLTLDRDAEGRYVIKPTT